NSSSACFFHCAICVGWTPYSAAISLAVFCPLMASNATFALISALYRFRCILRCSSLLSSRYSYFILSPCPVSGGYYKDALSSLLSSTLKNRRLEENRMSHLFSIAEISSQNQ